MSQTLAILIPAFNAEKTLPQLLERVRKVVPDALCVVVDDGSQDSTESVARENGAVVVHHACNCGKGAALRTGFSYLLSIPDVCYIITMDADLQHIPEDIPSFLKVEEQTNADIVIGKRQRKGSKMPLHRRLSNTLTSWLVSTRTKLPILDSQCGYRLIRRNVIEVIQLESNGYEAETEFLLKAARNGFTIAHAPIQTVYNNEKSYMTNWHTTINFLNVLLKEYA
ncbi:MAG TPA: glycosyltransferase family 2 protein [Bacteroidota bacterium]|nr:glycosyltransferase family 2 protein [Bacteroidota bacterium]